MFAAAGQAAMKWARGAPGGVGRGVRGAGRWAGGVSEDPMVKGFASRAMAGAIGGMAMSIPTAGVDRDRSVFSSGVVGGAIWGGLAGAAGYGVGRGFRAGYMKAAKTAGRGSIDRTIAMQGARGARLLSNGSAMGAGLTGAYGLAQFAMGGSRRRKHYTTFHHGEYRNQNQQRRGGYR